MVDDSDYEIINQWKWYAHKSANTYYACRMERIEGKRSIIRMHRAILGLKDNNVHVDHIDHDGLNNQRNNIRICNSSRNQGNSLSRKGTSQYKGVSWDKARNKWIACVKFKYRHIHLGRFEHEIEAARAYNKAAQQYFGEFAYINIMYCGPSWSYGQVIN